MLVALVVEGALVGVFQLIKSFTTLRIHHFLNFYDGNEELQIKNYGR